MDIILKTLLYSYPTFDVAIEGLEKLVEYKALTSFANCHKTVKQMEEIIKINSQSERIYDLKRLVNGFLDKLTLKERMLIEYKFFKYKMPEGFDYCSRRYFREQLKVFEKLLKIMEKNKYDEKWFKSNYGDIFFLQVKYKNLKRTKKQCKANNSKMENWA